MSALDGTSGKSSYIPIVGLKIASVSFCNKRCRWERRVKKKSIGKKLEKLMNKDTNESLQREGVKQIYYI